MTENELKKTIAIYKKTLEVTADNGETCFRELDKNTLLFLEELEQYRAIGTVEEIQQKLAELDRWHTSEVNQLAEEYNNDFCEWRRIRINTYIAPTCVDGKYFEYEDMKICPYCGKKIKVVE